MEYTTAELAQHLDEAFNRLKSIGHLSEEGAFGEADRKTISDTFDSFSAFLTSSKRHIAEVRRIVHAALDSRILIDQVIVCFPFL